MDEESPIKPAEMPTDGLGYPRASNTEQILLTMSKQIHEIACILVDILEDKRE